MKFNHIGIFLSNIKTGETFFKKIIKIKRKSRIFFDIKLGVKVRFLYDDSGICYEIVAPYGKNNPVNKVLKKKGNILNHVAYETKNLKKTINYLRKINCAPITKPQSAKAFNNRKIIFFLTPLNFIIEIIQK